MAAFRAAEELRRSGFEGAVTMLCGETIPPYDRPPLSKAVLVGNAEPAQTVYRAEDFYREQQIDLLLGHKATGVDVQGRFVRAAGKLIDYTDLIICTGSSPRRLNSMGRLQGIHELRTIDDAYAVRKALLAGPRVVVVGAGFIGAEVAASARALGLDVTIVEASAAPLVRAVGSEMGRACAGLHADNGARLLLNVTIEAVEGRDQVERLRLSDGSRLECDLLVVGIGVLPNVDWLAGSGITIGDGIVCDVALRTNVANVYAAGDVASWHNMLFDKRMRGEQWTNAIEQGRHVARQIVAGAETAAPFCGNNYFWSDQYGVKIQFAGIADADEIVVVDGGIGAQKFLAWYRRGDRLVGALAMDAAKLLMFSKTLIDRRCGWGDALTALEKQRVPAQIQLQAAGGAAGNV